MAIKFNTSNVNKIFFGTSEVKKVFAGSTEVWGIVEDDPNENIYIVDHSSTSKTRKYLKSDMSHILSENRIYTRLTSAEGKLYSVASSKLRILSRVTLQELTSVNIEGRLAIRGEFAYDTGSSYRFVRTNLSNENSNTYTVANREYLRGNSFMNSTHFFSMFEDQYGNIWVHNLRFSDNTVDSISSFTSTPGGWYPSDVEITGYCANDDYAFVVTQIESYDEDYDEWTWYTVFKRRTLSNTNINEYYLEGVADVRKVEIDSSHLYVFYDNKVEKRNISNLSLVGTISSIYIPTLTDILIVNHKLTDDTHIFVLSSDYKRVRKYLKSNLSYVSQTAEADTILCITIDETKES